MPQGNQAASKVGVEMSQDDTLKRDMTHQAPLSPIRALDMVFIKEQTLWSPKAVVETRMPTPGRAGDEVEEAWKCPIYNDAPNRDMTH